MTTQEEAQFTRDMAELEVRALTRALAAALRRSPSPRELSRARVAFLDWSQPVDDDPAAAGELAEWGGEA
jgi:hypothetical protein